jgi:hypothetical protein
MTQKGGTFSFVYFAFALLLFHLADLIMFHMHFGYTSLLAAFLLFDTFGCGDCVTADF